jgi:fatty acid desaturase
LIGGIGGSAIGILGGVIGTYFSVMNTAGPRERAFMIRAAALAWVAVAAFLAALWWIPFPYRFLLWLPYVLALPLAIRAGNRRQERIRREEASGAGSGESAL